PFGTEMDSGRQGFGQPAELRVFGKLGLFFFAPDQLDRIGPEHQRQLARDDAEVVVEGDLSVQLVEEREIHTAFPADLAGEGAGGVDEAAGGDRSGLAGQAYGLHPAVPDLDLFDA